LGLCSTPSGQHAFAIWQSKGLAKLLQKIIGKIRDSRSFALGFIEK
jgi:hypothetical protein